MSEVMWHYAVGGQQGGPVSWDALRQMAAARQIGPQDLVWQQGTPNWQPASAVQGLFDSDVAPARPGYPPPYPASHYAPGAPDPRLGYYTPEMPVRFAGFWIRVVAAIIDGLIVFIPTELVTLVTRLVLGLDPTPIVPSPGPPGPELAASLIDIVQNIAIGWLYYALQEASVHQATLGKRACGIRVVGLDLGRISFGRATGRYFAEMISGLTLCIGYMMAGWTQRKQALHDLIASTYVVYSGE